MLGRSRGSSSAPAIVGPLEGADAGIARGVVGRLEIGLLDDLVVVRRTIGTGTFGLALLWLARIFDWPCAMARLLWPTQPSAPSFVRRDLQNEKPAAFATGSCRRRYVLFTARRFATGTIVAVTTAPAWPAIAAIVAWTVILCFSAELSA